MNWYLEVLKKYAVFSGRAQRKEYWYFCLFNLIIGLIFTGLDSLTGTFSAEAGMGILGFIYSLAIMIPGLAVTVRRLHDTDRTGWWLFITLIPIIGGIVLLVFLVQDGTPDENRFGLNPKIVAA
jgi:uncharacterized membrane protein YhaH (DUF805 family)